MKAKCVSLYMGNREEIEVTANLIDVPAPFNDYKFFAAKPLKGWNVYEYSTGLNVCSGAPFKSKEQAIENAIKVLNEYGLQALKNAIGIGKTSGPKIINS